MWPSSSFTFQTVHRVGLAKSASGRSRTIFETSSHSSSRASRGSAIADRIGRVRLDSSPPWGVHGEVKERVKELAIQREEAAGPTPGGGFEEFFRAEHARLQQALYVVTGND